ncbi:MAG: hypothetical protein ACKOYG_08960 [Ilumatobacteraceae bacterium]
MESPRLSAALAALGSHGREAAVAPGHVPSRSLPVCGALQPLLGSGGLRGGVVVACEGPAAVSLAMATASAASMAGSWTAVIGFPDLGLAAAAEAGMALERLVRIGPAEPVDAAAVPWPEVLAAAVDGFEVLIVGPLLGRLPSAVVRRVLARAATRHVVVIAVDSPAFGADLVLRTGEVAWHGIDAGHGVAAGRRAVVCASGRRMPRERRASLMLPSSTGCAEPAAPTSAAPTSAVPTSAVPTSAVQASAVPVSATALHDGGAWRDTG